jgi:hypothetical protein
LREMKPLVSETKPLVSKTKPYFIEMSLIRAFVILLWRRAYILSSENTVEDLDLSFDMEFTAERERSYALPIQPVLACEKSAVLEMIV